MFLKNVINVILKKFGVSISRVSPFHANTGVLFKVLKDLDYNPKLVIDIGAHKGDWSRGAQSIFSDSYFILIEPQTDLINEDDYFVRSEKVHVFHEAIGDFDGLAYLNHHQRRDSFYITRNRSNKEDLVFDKVKISTLDSFVDKELAHFPKADVLKIDAEGLDMKVLIGAEQTLKHIELVFVEAGINNQRFQNSALEVINKMKNYDFRLIDITDLNRPFDIKFLWNVELAFCKSKGEIDT
jgi:FkbM family methyltransferase